jgi:uncharacterized membrane protein
VFVGLRFLFFMGLRYSPAIIIFLIISSRTTRIVQRQIRSKSLSFGPVVPSY